MTKNDNKQHFNGAGLWQLISTKITRWQNSAEGSGKEDNICEGKQLSEEDNICEGKQLSEEDNLCEGKQLSEEGNICEGKQLSEEDNICEGKQLSEEGNICEGKQLSEDTFLSGYNWVKEQRGSIVTMFEYCCLLHCF